MLRQRVITSLILAPLIIIGVLKLPPLYFAVAWGIIILYAAWEWSDLAAVERKSRRALFVLGLAVLQLLLGSWSYLLHIMADLVESQDVLEFAGALDWLLIPALMWWLFISVKLRGAAAERLLQVRFSQRFMLSIGAFTLIIAWLFFYRLQHLYGADWALFFLVLIWVADIAAYFAGRKWGKTKLSPHISPGKTQEGMYAALLAAVALTVGVFAYRQFQWGIIADFAMLSVITVLFSVSGDLFESLAKRLRGVKDSGTLIAGHGGLLDRIDSLIAAIPVFYAGVLMIGIMRGIFAV